jgi:hypothetical protein
VSCRPSRVATVTLAVAVSGCGGGGGGGGGIPPQPPPPPCNLEKDVQVATPTPDSQAQKDLTRAQANFPAEGLPDAQRLASCRQQFQDIVETTHCSKHIANFCIRSCEQDADEEACLVPPRSELVMQKCREQSVAWFTSTYSGCQGFHLCGNKLEPPGLACQ